MTRLNNEVDKREQTQNLAEAVNKAAARVSSFKNIRALVEDMETARRIYSDSEGADEAAKEQFFDDLEALDMYREGSAYQELMASFGGADLFLELEIHSSLSRRDESSWKMYYPTVLATLDQFIADAEAEMRRLLE